MENKELQLILASAPLHTSPPAPLHKARVAREAELQSIDALIPAIEDWNKLALLLIDRGTAPLLYRKLPHLKNAALIPTQAQELLRKAYYKTVSRNTRIYEEFKGLSAVLQAHNIPFITLKGICMSEWLYEDTGLRQMSDIDILVLEEDGHRCLETLKQAGYVTIQDYTVDEFVDMKSQNHFNPLFRNDVMVEIHIRLQNTREIYQQNLKEVWRDAVPVIINGVQTLRLELSDMLIHACLHLDKHFVTSHVQFTSFNDIVNLVREITSPQPSPEERETANLQMDANLEGSKKENKEQTSILDFEKSIYQTKPRTDARTPSLQVPRPLERDLGRGREGWGEVFWERFEAKCIQYKFADTVFRYLVMVRDYYGAPLPDYLYEKYGPLNPPQGGLKSKNEDYVRFENFLAGTGNAFIGRGAPTSGTATHLLHLKALKNPIDFMRSRSNGMSTLSADRQVRYHTHRELFFRGRSLWWKNTV